MLSIQHRSRKPNMLCRYHKRRTTLQIAVLTTRHTLVSLSWTCLPTLRHRWKGSKSSHSCPPSTPPTSAKAHTIISRHGHHNHRINHIIPTILYLDQILSPHTHYPPSQPMSRSQSQEEHYNDRSTKRSRPHITALDKPSITITFTWLPTFDARPHSCNDACALPKDQTSRTVRHASSRPSTPQPRRHATTSAGTARAAYRIKWLQHSVPAIFSKSEQFEYADQRHPQQLRGVSTKTTGAIAPRYRHAGHDESRWFDAELWQLQPLVQLKSTERSIMNTIGRCGLYGSHPGVIGCAPRDVGFSNQPVE